MMLVTPFLHLEDCDDDDPTIINTNVNDADCDTIPSSEDCDDEQLTTLQFKC